MCPFGYRLVISINCIKLDLTIKIFSFVVFDLMGTSCFFSTNFQIFYFCHTYKLITRFFQKCIYWCFFYINLCCPHTIAWHKLLCQRPACCSHFSVHYKPWGFTFLCRWILAPIVKFVDRIVVRALYAATAHSTWIYIHLSSLFVYRVSPIIGHCPHSRWSVTNKRNSTVSYHFGSKCFLLSYL